MFETHNSEKSLPTFDVYSSNQEGSFQHRMKVQSSEATPWKINMELTNHPIWKGKMIFQTSMIMFQPLIFRGYSEFLFWTFQTSKGLIPLKTREKTEFRRRWPIETPWFSPPQTACWLNPNGFGASGIRGWRYWWRHFLMTCLWSCPLKKQDMNLNLQIPY